MAGFNSISGLNSGLDTPGIIDAIMAFERRNTNLLEEQQVIKQATITALQSLQAKFFALNSQLGQLKLGSTFEQGTVSSSDKNVLSASANGRVPTGSYDLRVLQLASNHQIASQGFSSIDESLFGSGDIKITVGNGSEQVVTVGSDNNSLKGIKNAINDARIGVTATIVNDGSSSDPYRLILTGDSTGVANKITINSSLIGGENLNYSTATFGSPESVVMNTGSSSQVSLGASAAFTGNENKIFTFTVQGTGEQTIGSDNITITWSDGVNPEQSIVVTQADTEVELVGAGADGLKLSFAAGTLTADDTFQIATFAPLLQEASDAKLAVGSTGGSGSPITVTSATNTFNDVIGGVTLNANGISETGTSVKVKTDLDVSAIKSKIQGFLDAFNEINEYIDKQNAYTQDSDSAPPLFGDFTVWNLQNSLRKTLSSAVKGLDSKYNQLATLGIRSNAEGNLTIKDSSRLETALRENLDDVINLFTDAGNSSNANIEFISSASATVAGQNYAVNITQPPTHGGYRGAGLSDPATTPITLDATNNRLKLKIDAIVSDEIALDQREYTTYAELVAELQSKIDNDDKIGSLGVEVKWVETGAGSGYLELVSPNYGETSKIELISSISNTAYSVLGLATGTQVAGKNVAGTINGEAATGNGVLLTGDEDNKTTAGLKLKILLDEADVGDGAEGTIYVTKGVASQLNDLVKSYTASKDGILDRRISSFQAQIDYLSKRVAENDKYLSLRRESLTRQYYEMELALGELNSQSSFLTSQLDSINMNWKFNQK
ncbi:MAG: flagellar filament capping protein FliD [bacterium]|nr:flagellar filament capping protein FliD [bacterium]